ncbi:MAG TPA: hypothetical protein VGD01_12440 [Candidatus Elarobacter sp.]
MASEAAPVVHECISERVAESDSIRASLERWVVPIADRVSKGARKAGADGRKFAEYQAGTIDTVVRPLTVITVANVDGAWFGAAGNRDVYHRADIVHRIAARLLKHRRSMKGVGRA